MKKIVLTILLAAFVHVAYCQSISGIIKDVKGTPMPYATVYIESLKQSAVSDAGGRYVLAGLPGNGRYTLKTSYIGCHTEQKEVVVNGNTTADFVLKEETITLDEFIVLPNGMDICKYVMLQLDKNIKPLKKRLSSYDCRTTARLEKDIDLSEMRRRRTIRFALMLAGWGKNFDTMVKYKKLSVTMAEDVHFKKGKITNSPLQIIAMNPQMTDKEVKSFCKKDWYLDDNSYDRFYDEVHKKVKSLKSKNSKYDVKFCGSYDEGGKTIYILRYGRTQVEVVSGCWQIRRMRYKSGSRSIYFEFSELAPGVFLPISGHADFNIDYNGFPHGTVKLSLSYKYKSVKK